MALRACLLALLVSVAAAAPAHAAGAFFDRFDFASVLAQDGERAIAAVGADGTLYLAYRDGSGNSPPGRVAIRTRSPQGTFSADQQLAQADPGNTGNHFPFGLGLAADGTATVHWRDNTGLNLFVRRFSRSGVLAATTTQVNVPGQVSGTDSDLAVRPSGSALVTWINGTTDRVALREVSPAGVAGTERPLSDPGDDPIGGPHVALAPDGTAFVAWRAGAAPSGAIFLRSVSPSGVLGPKLTIASGGDPGSTQVAVDAAGRVYVAWLASPENRVRLRVRRPDGSLGPIEDVSPAGAGSISAAVGGNGDAAFAWRAGGGTTIAGRRRSAAGGYGPVVTLAGPETGTGVQEPHVSIETGGEAVATWERTSAAVDVVEGRGFRRSSALDPVATLSDNSPSIQGNSAIAGDAFGRTMVVSQNGSTNKFRVQIGDFGGPEQRGLAAPPVVERGVPAVFSFTPFDAQSGIGASRWVFSDDGATVAAATTSHTFAKAGSFTARSISTDSVGNVRELTNPVRVADTRKPAISRVSLQRARFRLGAKPVARTAARRRAKRSTRLSYTLSEDTRVTLSVQRRTIGRRVGKSCRKATRKNRKRRRCVRYVKVKLAAISRTQKAGRRSVVFTGRVGKRKLKAGRYRFVLQARDPSGNLSAKRTKAFRIVR